MRDARCATTRATRRWRTSRPRLTQTMVPNPRSKSLSTRRMESDGSATAESDPSSPRRRLRYRPPGARTRARPSLPSVPTRARVEDPEASEAPHPREGTGFDSRRASLRPRRVVSPRPRGETSRLKNTRVPRRGARGSPPTRRARRFLRRASRCEGRSRGVPTRRRVPRGISRRRRRANSFARARNAPRGSARIVAPARGDVATTTPKSTFTATAETPSPCPRRMRCGPRNTPPAREEASDAYAETPSAKPYRTRRRRRRRTNRRFFRRRETPRRTRRARRNARV